ncbi:MAG: hypothetical protein FWG35_02680, partial [Spirochaetaceae bacterium]|nr:hypothetical protein [Spirochaetaceae bacterium]
PLAEGNVLFQVFPRDSPQTCFYRNAFLFGMPGDFIRLFSGKVLKIQVISELHNLYFMLPGFIQYANSAYWFLGHEPFVPACRERITV